jgi:hypothetical protein
MVQLRAPDGPYFVSASVYINNDLTLLPFLGSTLDASQADHLILRLIGNYYTFQSRETGVYMGCQGLYYPCWGNLATGDLFDLVWLSGTEYRINWVPGNLTLYRQVQATVISLALKDYGTIPDASLPREAVFSLEFGVLRPDTLLPCLPFNGDNSSPAEIPFNHSSYYNRHSTTNLFERRKNI